MNDIWEVSRKYFLMIFWALFFKFFLSVREPRLRTEPFSICSSESQTEVLHHYMQKKKSYWHLRCRKRGMLEDGEVWMWGKWKRWNWEYGVGASLVAGTWTETKKCILEDFSWNWQTMMCRLRIQKLKIGHWGGFEKINFFSFFLMRNREWGKGHFSKWKWPFPHSRFGHFRCPKRKSKTTSLYKHTPN